MAHPAGRVTTLAALAAALAGALTLTAGAGVPEWVFGSITMFALLLVLDHGVRSWRLARRERLRTARCPGSPRRRRPGRRSSTNAAGWPPTSPRACGSPWTLSAGGPRRRRSRPIRRPRSTRSTGRRGGPPRTCAGTSGCCGTRAPPGDPTPTPVPAPRAPNGRDLLIAAAVSTLAVIEAIAYPLLDGTPRGWLSVVLTGLAAAAIVGRRTVPGPATLAIGLNYLVALAFGAPVSGGFWCLATVGGVLWTIAVRPTLTRRHATCAGFLLLAAGASAWLLDPDNAALLILNMIVALAGGGAVRFARAHIDTARERAHRHEDEIGAATAPALVAERTAFAREIHDIVSHAVGLIAVQAAAAEVSWPAATRQALDVIAAIATATLADLDRLPPHRPARESAAGTGSMSPCPRPSTGWSRECPGGRRRRQRAAAGRATGHRADQ